MHVIKKMSFMENNELFELIESYLDGTLPQEKRMEVEQRMSNDVVFRHEVELHRGLQKNFASPERWGLRSILSEIVKEPIVSEGPSFQKKSGFRNNLKKLLFFSAAVLVVILLWFWFKPPTDQSRDEPIKLPHREERSPPMAGIETDTVTTKTFKEIVTSEKETEENLALASADPEDFAVNSSMEALVNSSSRGNDEVSVVISSPVNATSFTPGKNGEIIVGFAGGFEGISENTSEIILSIFNNKDSSKPLLSQSLELKKDDTSWAFDVKKRFTFPLGLYYFTIEHENEIMYTGKFTIGKIIFSS